MSYPPKPAIQTSYTAIEQALGDGTLPGQELDVDLANLKSAIDALNDFVSGLTRSDGRLGNNTVTRDTLASDVLIGIDPPAPWETGRAYSTPDSVFEDNKFYLALTEHTSGNFQTDLDAGRWLLLADFTVVQEVSLAAQTAAEVARDEAVEAKDDVLSRYLGSFSEPPTTGPDGAPLIAGTLYFDNNALTLFVYNGTDWVSASSAISGVRQVFRYTATSGQVEFSGPDNDGQALTIDNPELVAVYVNGIRFVTGAQYSVDAVDNSVTLVSAADPGDTVQIEVFGNLNASPPEGVSVTQIAINGTTFTGAATQGEAEAGTADNRIMTPLRVAQAIAEQVVIPDPPPPPDPVPAGTVFYMARNTAPNGYLKADGSAVSRSTYADLFDAIGTTFGNGDGSTTFNLPDLRGEFIRGWSDGRNVDSGRGFGSNQLDQMQRVTGSAGTNNNNTPLNASLPDGPLVTGSGAIRFIRQATGSNNGTSTGTGSRYSLSFDNNRVARTGDETRPRNIALLAVIKY